MIRLHSTPHRNDIPALVVTYATNQLTSPIIRLVPEPLETAETVAFSAVGVEKMNQTHIGFTPKRAAGFPAWAILTDPDNAQHALNLVADVEWARRKAHTHAGQVKDRIDELTVALQNSAPHFLPTFLEEIARIFALAGNIPYGKQYFNKARDIEEFYALPIDNERHSHAFTEFTKLGVVTAKALSNEAKNVATRMEPQEAFDYFFNLLIDQVRAGVSLYVKVFKDLEALAKNAGIDPEAATIELIAAYLPSRSFPETPESLLNTILTKMPRAVAQHPDLADIFYTITFGNWDINDYVAVLQNAQLWEPLCADPQKFVPWLEAKIAFGNWRFNFFHNTNQHLLDAIDRNKDALRGRRIATNRATYHLDYIDALIAAGARWSTLDSRFGRLMVEFFDAWLADHHRDLSHLLGREEIRWDFVEYLTFQQLAKNWDLVFANETVLGIATDMLENLHKELTSATDFARKKMVKENRNYLTDPRLKDIHPEVIAMVVPDEATTENTQTASLSDSAASQGLATGALNKIPKPPELCSDYTHLWFNASLHKLAEEFNDPKNTGHALLDCRLQVFVGSIGREKVWLASLAAPGIPLDVVRTYCEFLHWCADYGVLGAKLSSTVRSQQIYVHSQPPADLRAYDDFFVPKYDFKKTLDEILAWHEKRHSAGKLPTLAWDNVSLYDIATRAAATSTLPPRVWASLLTGSYLHKIAEQTRINTPELAKALGTSVTALKKLRAHTGDNFCEHDEILLGLGWHDNYLTEGPNIDAICTFWEDKWGVPWIHLTDDMWDGIPTQLYENISASFHREPFPNDAYVAYKFTSLLPVYLHLAHLVEPGSEDAHTLAGRINAMRDCDYSSPVFHETRHQLHSLQAVREGHLDTLLNYLTEGTPIAGTKQDPLISAPESVADAAETLGLSEEAAKYFLQLLALSEPTDAAVKKWNNWTKKQFDEAQQELMDKNLAVTAKRTGAKRGVFLPGGWLEKSDTGPAMEMWKAPHYLLWDDTKCRPIVDTCPPILPYPNLFAEVWERYKSGDTPGYEKLTTKRYRSRR
ncbi:MAG: hypothetical protein Q4D85_08730 [Corynebacterium sp.]|uniref:hypothetical protein n=1 Tax=Corynebacterium sp. TaxID=1720 RepID=UPI0026DC3F55|nr:hypothetical protein [Corynebacterium sp.]MDO5098831.1 hypothetical protein [Corynebacterium sp.]